MEHHSNNALNIFNIAQLHSIELPGNSVRHLKRANGPEIFSIHSISTCILIISPFLILLLTCSGNVSNVKFSFHCFFSHCPIYCTFVTFTYCTHYTTIINHIVSNINYHDKYLINDLKKNVASKSKYR